MSARYPVPLLMMAGAVADMASAPKATNSSCPKPISLPPRPARGQASAENPFGGHEMVSPDELHGRCGEIVKAVALRVSAYAKIAANVLGAWRDGISVPGQCLRVVAEIRVPL